MTRVAVSSGNAGRILIATRLPAISPAACAVTITDQARAPPQCCFATTGPST